MIYTAHGFHFYKGAPFVNRTIFKWIEQWIIWIVVDILSAGLYGYKGLYLTAILYAIYAVIAIFGYRKWQQIMKTQNAE